MRRALVLGLAICLAVSAAAVAQDKQKKADKTWFDMENFAMCKNISSQPGLMEAMKWEVHKIDNGMLLVANIPENMDGAWKKAMAGMDATKKELESGKQLQLCGFCQAFGKAIQDGAQEENVDGSFSKIQLITSDDPEVIKQLHDIADRCSKEMKAMQENTSKAVDTTAAKPTYKKK